MDRNMKHLLWSVGFSLLTLQVQAQAPAEEQPAKRTELPREVPNPEKLARQETDRLKEALELTDKQCKKVYKLVLKEQRERFERRMQRPPMRDGEAGRGPRPPREGGMPPMGMGGGRPGGEGMEMSRPPMARGQQPETAEEMHKRIEEKNKKMKKILTEAQYDRWLGMSQKPANGPKPEDGPAEETRK